MYQQKSRKKQLKKNNMKELKFCYDKTIFPAQKRKNTLKAVWDKSKYWRKGQVIKVFFINGASYEQAEMKKALSEIAFYTKLSFIYTTNRQESDIRVSFNKGWGSYSYVGTDALFIPKSMETINIGWRGLDVCRHEALHAMGALHEHQNPNEGIEWDEQAVIEDLSGAPNYWTEEEIRHNVLNKLKMEEVDASAYDPNSIMVYYFPASWTKNGVSSKDNLDFSAQDIQFMKDIYGYTEKDVTAPHLTLNGDSELILEVGDTYVESGAVAIDNKDGNISQNIIVRGTVDTSKEGMYLITYSVEDAAGNKSEKIRTIMVQSNFEVKAFVKNLFPTRYRLEQLTETQLVQIANSLDIEATTTDLKSDTVNKIWVVLELINQ